MTQPAVSFEFRVPESVRRALRHGEFMREPARDFIRTAAFAVQADAMRNSPVDRGRLRGSISTRLSQDGLEARVGTNVQYAPFVEFGSRPHWPPLSAMQPWARRHGFPAGRRGAFLVARAIARHGTRARRFMGRALASEQQRAGQRMNALATAIARRWERLS